LTETTRLCPHNPAHTGCTYNETARWCDTVTGLNAEGRVPSSGASFTINDGWMADGGYEANKITFTDRNRKIVAVKKSADGENAHELFGETISDEQRGGTSAPLFYAALFEICRRNASHPL